MVKPTFAIRDFFIIVLGTVDARGIFVSVNAGRPVSLGDSYCYKNSKLKQMIDSNQWLSPVFSRTIRRMKLRLYLVTDAAFPLGATVMKCLKEVICSRTRRASNTPLLELGELWIRHLGI